MSEIIEEFNSILDKEDNLLDILILKQSELRKSVIEKNWETLVKEIADINQISDEFQIFDKRRDEIQNTLTQEELEPCFEKIRQVRSKLLKCKIENRVLSDYVNIAKSFIQEVVERALPRVANKNYTRDGKIVQPQPQSVILNQLF